MKPIRNTLAYTFGQEHIANDIAKYLYETEAGRAYKYVHRSQPGKSIRCRWRLKQPFFLMFTKFQLH